MAYPADKETFRRVVNQELPTIPGDTVDADDNNKPVDFLERLEDTLGYGIKMGFANVKAFFDDINARFTGLNRNKIIPLYQNVSPVAIPASTVEYFGGDLTLLATDKVILQANVLWKTTSAASGSGYWSFYKLFDNISPYLQPSTFLQNVMITSTYNYIIQSPDAGTANYRFRIDNRSQAIEVEQISVVAIIISV